MSKTTFDAKKRYKPKNRRYKKPTVYALAKELRQLKKDTTAQIETKVIHKAHNFSVTNVPFIVNVSEIGEGDGDNQRTGNTVSPVKYNLMIKARAETAYSNEARVIVFRWFDDVAPTVNDILYSNATGIFAALDYINIPTVYQRKPQYQIISDQVQTFVSTASNEEVVFSCEKVFKKSAQMHFTDSSGTSNLWGQIYIMIVSDSLASPHPVMQGYSRLLYKDA